MDERKAGSGKTVREWGRITTTREDLWEIKKMSDAGVVEDRKEGLEKLLIILLYGTFSQPCIRSLDSRTSI
jgi:hypothetical protein